MSDIVSTITIPAQGDPNFLHSALHALLRLSYFKHRIIVIWDRADVFHPGQGGPRDFAIDPASGEARQPFKSIEELRIAHEPLWQAHGVEFWDVSDGYLDLYNRYCRGEVWPGKTAEPEQGVNIAFKNNIGLEQTTTEWTIPNWDTDFHPCRHWDRPIFEYAQALPAERHEVLVPMHCQPQIMSDNPRDFDAWGEKSRSFARNRMAVPTSRIARDQPWVDEDDWLAYAERNKRDGQQITEEPGRREWLHWVPWVLRTAQAREAGGFNMQGGGYDIEFDDRLRARGFMKTGLCASFVLHKGWCPIPPGACDLVRP